MVFPYNRVKKMCLFPFKNVAINSIAYKKGVTEFSCGCCPECLSHKARYWALRCYAEAQYNIGCMVTLTYDDYKIDKYGRKTKDELPVNPELHVSKRHCQLFMKRLRKHFKDCKLLYLICSEYGKKSHRAHYHAILFGIKFDDLIFYKRSKRGNAIYKSNTLTNIWGHGIATVDAVNINAQVARYCTKYCAKDTRTDDTFMLFSHGIGDKWLMEKFNGKSYLIDGREYPIPRTIWQKKVMEYINDNYEDDIHAYDNYFYSKPNEFGRYFMSSIETMKKLDLFYHKHRGLNQDVSLLCASSLQYRYPDYKYRSLRFYSSKISGAYSEVYALCNQFQRRLFALWRDNWNVYKAYLTYWKEKNDSIIRKPVLQRIRELPDDKYFSYKQKALSCYGKRKQLLVTPLAYEAEDLVLPPRYVSARKLERSLECRRLKYSICAYHPCHISANDTIDYYVKRFISEKVPDVWFNVKKEYVQLTI